MDEIVCEITNEVARAIWRERMFVLVVEKKRT